MNFDVSLAVFIIDVFFQDFVSVCYNNAVQQFDIRFKPSKVSLDGGSHCRHGADSSLVLPSSPV